MTNAKNAENAENTADNAPVLCTTLAARNGARIGVLTLNAPATLNALSLPMIDLLHAQLSAWADDATLVMVLLQAAGEKAFCAGGDLQDLYRSILAQRAAGRADVLGNPYAADFFGREYRLDYLIHTYPKPILCWGRGIVMGGGIGLMAGASHRVVTEKSRLAMPEIGIGLFPDVGGSWFLNRMPGRLGLFLALTGAPVSGTDAIFLKLADHIVAQAEQANVIAALQTQAWSADPAANAVMLTALLKEAETASGLKSTAGPLRRNFDLINDCCDGATLAQVLAALAAVQSDELWLQKACAAPAAGAPGSLALAWELLHRTPRLSLAEVLRMEYGVALHCAAQGDFAEGIRALLIDKDQRPVWQAATATAHFLATLWPPQQHPLADLGAE